MDELKCKRYTSETIDLKEVISIGGNARKKVARRRWAILAKALKSPQGSEPSSPTDEFSVRRISSFMLLTTQQLQSVSINSSDTFIVNQAKKRTWYAYGMDVDGEMYSVVVGHRIRTFSAEDLMGFNNTGNVCIWPSEETLTYYIGSNLQLFKHKSVLELGGGMSCLAGLVCAKYGNCRSVALTDGNKMSVENVQVSVSANDLPCPVTCGVLKWGQSDDRWGRFDVILCADCLFFDEARADLIETLWDLLSRDGFALIMAPKRGSTLEHFIAQSTAKGFRCKQIVNYNNLVWQKHLSLLENCDYDDNIHYPILIEMTKV
ncbi:PREDICTED: calmodulin-lysine N-methyltransferase [Nicrophorus vespilloides]|uniref:Calmodulin-lysine N-methyltransferase n=1 Tax=Nicrophorus vespilloides TaxID=110193 RepID=A0ABM1M4C5_NICVS|nr:PREDICTED: calmodulin-lysine N-methyltransferase [Nicrophorus vespilloides]